MRHRRVGLFFQCILRHSKTLGTTSVPYRDPTLGKLVDGTVEYDTMVKDFEAYKKRVGDEDLAMSLTVYDKDYGVMSQPVEYTGKTFTLDGTTPITSEIQNIIKEAGGYSNAYMREYFPVGDMLDYREQGMLPPEVIDAFYDAGYTPPEYKAMDAVSQNIVNKVYTKDSPYDFDNIGDLLGDTVGLGARAIGQLAETFNYANAATNWLGMTDLDIPNTWLGKAATFLEKTGMDMHSPQYKAALEDYNQGYTDARANTVAEYRAQYVADNDRDRSGMSKTERAEFNAAADAYAEEKANSFVGGAKTVFGGIANAPGMFFNEFIASEVMQELPVLGAGLLVKGGSLAAAKAAGREIAESTATKLGLGAGVATRLCRVFRGGAQQGYDTAYDSYIRMNMRDGMDPPQRRQVEIDAKKYAEDAAMVGGITNLLITGVSMGVINANSFEKLIVGGKKVDSPTFEKFVDDVTAVVTETGQEAAEEAGTAAAVGLFVGKDDPSVLASLPADISQGTILGGLAGGGTAGSLVIGQNVFQSTGNPVIDTLIRTNAGVQNTLYPEYAPPGTQTTAHKNPDELKKALQDIGVSDNAVLNTLLNTTYDAQFVTTTEAGDMFVKANPGFTPTESEIAKFAGTRAEANLAADVAAYVDPRFLDADEVKAAALAEGITLTDEQAEAYVGQKNESSAVTSIRKEYDPKATTYEEAEKFFADLGFTPSKEQIDQFVGAKPESTQKTAVGSYVDPRQVTEAEARKFYEDLGYTPTAQEIAQFVGQGGSTFEKTAPKRVETYVDPRQVTNEEARQFFADLGYTPTAEEVANYVGQGGGNFESTAPDRVGSYVDPRQVTEAEARKFFVDQGYTPTAEEVANYVGQGGSDLESTASDRVGSYVDPRQVTEAEARKFFADLGYTPTAEEVANYVGQGGSDLESTAPDRVGSYVDPRQVTEAEARKFFADLGYTPTAEEVANYVGQGGSDFESTAPDRVETYVDPRQVTDEEVRTAYAALGLKRPTDDDIQALIGQYMETDLAGRAEENLPTARYNSIMEILDNFTGEVGVSDEMKEALETVKGDMIDALGDLGLEVAAIDRAVTDVKAAVDALPVGASPEDVSAAINDAISGLENLSAEDVNTAITTAALEGRNNLSTDDVQGIVDAATGTLEGAISDVKTDLTKLIEDNAGDVDTALAELAADLGITEAALLAELNTTKEALSDQFTAGLSTLETDLTKLIEDNAGDVDTALAELAADLGITEAALLAELNTTKEALSDQFTTGLSALETDLTKLIEDNAGDVDTALAELAADLGTTEEALLAELDTTKEALSDQFTAGLSALETDLTKLIEDNAGDVDTALAELAADLGTTEAALLEELGTTKEALSEQFTAGLSALETDLTKLIEDNAGDVDTALAELAADLGTTEAALLAELGTTKEALSEQFTAGLSALETDLTKLIEDNAGDVDTALAELAADLGTTEAALLEELDTTKEALSEQFTAGLSALEEDIGGVAAGVDDLAALVEEYEAAGVDRDTAMSLALEQLSTELGQTETDILAELGLTEAELSDRIDTSTEQLSGELANAKTDLLALIEANEAAGMTRDEATQAAIGELANAFDVGRTELLTAIDETEASLVSQIGDVETSLGEQITDVETSLGADIQTVADLIGKPAREVTQTDIDFVVDLIAQENVAAETIRQYDVTGDGILDVNDQNMLMDALQGNDVTLADTSMFNPATGLYLQQEQDTQTTLDAILDMNTQINTNIDTEAKNASQRDFLQAAGMGAFDGRGVTVTTPDPMNIDYLYDISGDSIFATPSQASLFASPYGGTRAPTQTAQPVQPTQPFATTPRRFAQGGQVEDETDMLLRILGGS
jgi:hypothetical protein